MAIKRLKVIIDIARRELTVPAEYAVWQPIISSKGSAKLWV